MRCSTPRMWRVRTALAESARGAPGASGPPSSAGGRRRRPPWAGGPPRHAAPARRRRAPGHRRTASTHAPQPDRPRAVAHLVAGVEALAAVAQQPVVVQRVDDGDAARRQHVHDVGRQARQVVHVRHVGPPLVDEPRRDRARSPGCDRTPRSWSDRAERVVDPRHAQAVARLDPHVVFGPRRILLARQHEHVVAAARRAAPARCW